MAINLVIKVDETFNPNHDNIIVYNSKKKIWEPTTKQAFLNEVNIEFKNKDLVIEEMKKEIETLNSKISKLAQIMKGELM